MTFYFRLKSVLILLFISFTSQAQTENKNAIRYFMEEAIGTALHIETHTEDFVAHSGNNQPYDVKTDYAAALEIKKAFPDIFYKVIRMVEENDYVVAHWKALGTNTGISSYIPVATNKSIEIEGVTIYKLIDGKIAEEWTQSNLITILFNLKLI